MQFSERTDGANFHIIRINRPLNMAGKLAAFKREISLLPSRVANMGREHTMANFEAEGFIDNGVKRWKNKKSPNGQKILVDTGRMKRSIRAVRAGNVVTLTAPVPYASIHNRPVGEMKTYGGKRYPGRKFMGNSKELRDGIHKMIKTRLNLAAAK